MSTGTNPNDNLWLLAEMGPMASWSDFVLERPGGLSLQGKGFLGQRLGLTGIEVSLNAMPPGQSVPFSHAHKQNEELYLFLSGSGEMLLDNEIVKVGAGSAVRINPAVVRCWRNTGDVPLTCIVVQAKAGSLEQATRTDGIVPPDPPHWP
jgi:uncharacterized cupin superfamily protein